MVIRPYYQGPFLSRVDKRLVFAYMASGAITTLSDYLVFTIVFSYLNLGLLAATVIAYLVGLVVSFLLNRYWVFRHGADRQSGATSLWRYGTFLAINLGITYAILWTLEIWFGISPYLGKFVVSGFMFFWIYLGDTFWVFHGERTGPIQL
jgi:putative flippase GtrA